MPDRAAIFDAVIRANSEGKYGRLDGVPGDEGSPERFLFNHTRKQIEKRIPQILRRTDSIKYRPGIHFDFVDCSQLNAVAFAHDSFGYVGIFRGTIYLLHDVFCRVFSHPAMFLRAGNISVEMIRPIHFEKLCDDYEYVKSQRPPDVDPVGHVLPIDADRCNYAAFTALIAIDFLSEHELGHLCFGHPEYLNRLGIEIISELRLKKGSGHPGNLTAQALAYQADHFALSTSLGAAMRSEFPSIPNPQTTQGKMCRLLLWQFAIMTTFWMFGLEFDENDMDAEEHPFPVVRIAAIQAATHSLLRQKFPELSDYFNQVAGDVVFGTARTMKAISGEIEDSNYLRAVKAANGPIIHHVNRIWKHLKDIAGDIEKTSFIEIPKFEEQPIAQ